MGKKLSDEEIQDYINKIIEMSKENNNIIPSNKEIFKNIIPITTFSKHLKDKGYMPWIDYFRNLGFHKKGDFKLKSGKYVPPEQLTLDNLYELFDIFKINNGYIADREHYNLKNNLPSWYIISRIINDNKLTLQDFFNNMGRKKSPRSSKKDYQKYLSIFKDECINKKRALFSLEVDKNKNLPSMNWLVKNCPNENVKTYNDFIIWCGFIPHKNISKEVATNIIFQMQSKLNRPITAKDFDNPQVNEIGIKTIYRIWGETWIMQKELGLKITGKHQEKYTIDELKKNIINICNKVYNEENRKIIMYSDIQKSGIAPSKISTYNRYLKKEKTTLREFIKSIGFTMTNEGMGLNYKFNDGEKVMSSYEYEFSKKLKQNNLKYNKDYFRDVKYSTFIKGYTKMQNCDYVIHYDNRIIYIEIAGIIGRYKENFLNNIPITSSKSKEKYRLKLLKKEKMLKENNLEYYILFPSDLQEDFLMSVFNKELINK